MNYILSLVASLFILASCSSTKEVVKDTNTSAEEISAPQEVENQVVFADLAKDDSLFASVKKGYCFGTCPVYEMKIYNSGYVKLEGKANLDMVGVFSTKLTHKQMTALIDYAIEINYMGLDDEYDNIHISDLPETKSSIVIEGQRKSVRRRYGFPKSIVVFEKMFASFLETEEWTTIKEGRDIK